MSYLDDFRTEIEAFLTKSGMSATRLGKEAVGDPRLVFDLRKKGRAPSARLMDEVIAFMAEHGTAPHPSALPRPMAPLDSKDILLIISGGIAAYKGLDLIRRLREGGG